MEEAFFLGLRLNRGVDLIAIQKGLEMLLNAEQRHAIDQSTADGLLEGDAFRIRLTPRGRLLSNEVFARFIADKTTVTA
jgi:oxygen-independent coproporphyrinogen-3 oxidase